MASLLDWYKDRKDEVLGTNIQAGERSIANAQQQLRDNIPRYGVLAQARPRQEFVSSVDTDQIRRNNEIRRLQQSALTGNTLKSVAAANIKAIGANENVRPNTANNVLKPSNPLETAGQNVINVATNRKVAPIALGIGRSAAGTGEGLSGLYDLATPGTGNNRFGQAVRSFGETTDNTVKANNYNSVAYKSAQLGTDIATFMIGGAPFTKGVAKAGNYIAKAPGVARATTYLDDVSKGGNLAQRGLVKGATYLARPDNIADVITDTALSTGLRANRGQDVSPGSIGLDATISTAFGGGIGLAGYGAKGAAKKAVNTFNDVKIGRAESLSGLPSKQVLRDPQTNTLRDFADYVTGSYNPDNKTINKLVRDARDAGQLAGIDVTSGSPAQITDRIYDYLGKRQKYMDANKVVKDVSADYDPRLNGADQSLNPQQNQQPRINSIENASSTESITEKYVREYADILKSMDDGATGGQMVPDGEGGLKRITEHSPAYRQFYAENGRKPSNKEWLEIARKEVQKDSEFIQYAKDSAKNDPKGFIVSETKPRNGRVDTIRAYKDPKSNKLITTRQTEDAPGYTTMSDAELNSLADNAPPLTRKEELLAGIKNYGKLREPQTHSIPRDIPDVSNLKDKAKKQVFYDLTDKYLGQERTGVLNAEIKSREYNDKFGGLTDKQKLEAILLRDGVLESSSDTQVNSAVAEMSKIFDDAYRYFTDEKGIKMGYQHEYLPRIYKNGRGELVNAAEYKLLQAGSKRQKGRTAELVNPDALISKDPADLIEKYFNSLEKAAAGKQYIKDLEVNGLVSKSMDGSQAPGLRPIVAEGLQPGDGSIYFAKKDVADKLNNMFGDKEAVGAFSKILEGGAKFSAAVQDMVLSGGVPLTPINNFAIMQGVKEALATHPVRAGKAFIKSFSPAWTNKTFVAKQDTILEMAKMGIDPRVRLGKDMSATADFKNAQGTLSKAKTGFDLLVSDPTFKRMMPLLQIQHYEGVKKSAIKKGVSPDEATKTAAQSTRNFYGLTRASKSETRNPDGERFTTATLLAPKFRESMINFWTKNVQAFDPSGGFKNARSLEYRDNVKFMVMSGVAWAAMDALNKELNGVGMLDNPDDKKDKLLIPSEKLQGVGINTNGKDIGLPFLSSIATLPRNAAMAGFNLATGNLEGVGKNLSTLPSIAASNAARLATNEDYFGNRIVDEDATTPEKYGQAASYLVKNTNHPWVREGLNAAGKALPEEAQKFLGIRDQSGFETASKAAELPLRFYNPNYYKYDGKKSSLKAGGRFSSTNADASVKIDGEYKKISELSLTQKLDAQFKALKNGDIDSKAIKETVAQIAPEINKLKVRGKELPVNTYTARLWSDYQAKIDNGKTSKLELANATKTLQRDLYKSDLKGEARNVLDLAIKSDSDLKNAVNEGLVSKEDFEKALKLDNFFMENGLLSSPYIGNSLREDMGYEKTYAKGKEPKGKKGKKAAAGSVGTALKTANSKGITTQARPGDGGKPTPPKYQPIQLKKYSNGKKIPQAPKITVRKGIA